VKLGSPKSIGVKAIRSGKVNAMHTHFIIVLSQLVSLLG
jgi:hypothetical protein